MDTPLSIYVLVDALGWEVVRNRPFLDDVLPPAYRPAPLARAVPTIGFRRPA